MRYNHPMPRRAPAILALLLLALSAASCTKCGFFWRPARALVIPRRRAKALAGIGFPHRQIIFKFLGLLACGQSMLGDSECHRCVQTALQPKFFRFP